MKKITDNSKIGNLTSIVNILVFLFLIISMVQLMKFDKVNKQYVDATPVYEKALDALRLAEQPTKADSAVVAHYQHRMDTLKTKPIPTNKSAAKAFTEERERIATVLKDKQELKNLHDSITALRRAEYAPIESSYTQLKDVTNAAEQRFNLFYTLTFVLLAVKIVLFAFWNYKNSQNLLSSVVWAKKATSPIWTFASWIIPVYNFIKPYSVTNEIFNDTEYLLKEKDIVPENYDQNDYNNFYVALWWGFFLLVIIGIVLINGTFFKTGALFEKLNHLNVALFIIVLWAVYLFLECFVIFRYNKMNKLLVDNQDKL